MKPLLTLTFAFLTISVPALAQDTTPVATPEAEKSPIDIPFEKFVLDNGLTVIVAPDHTVPTTSHTRANRHRYR